MAKSKKSSGGSADGPETSARRRGIQKPRTRTFRYSENSKPASRIPKDDKTINRHGPQVEILRPRWNSTTPTTARLFPMFCAEDPNGPFDPTRLTCNAYDFSDWCRGLPAAKYVGIDQKYTFITHDPRRVADEGYDARKENPYNVLYNAIMDAVKEGEAIIGGRDVMTGKWGALTADGPKKAFNSPTKLYFMQGLIFEHDGENYIKGGKAPKGTRKEDLPIIIEVSKTAGEDLAKKLNQIRPDYNGDTDPDLQGDMYEYGDLVDLKSGLFVTFYNPDKHDVTEGDDQDGEEGGTEAPAADDDADDSRQFKGWKTAVSREFHYINKRRNFKIDADISQYEDIIREKLLWWDDVLYVPSHEELCFWLAQAFRSIPNLLHFGWSDHPEFFTDEVKGVLSNRTQGPGAEVPTDDDDEDEPVATPSRKAKRTSAALQEVDDDEDDDIDDGSDVEDSVVDDTDDDSVLDDDVEDDDEDDVEDNDAASAAEAEAEKAEEARLERAASEAAERAAKRKKPAEAAKPKASKPKPKAGKVAGKRSQTPNKARS